MRAVELAHLGKPVDEVLRGYNDLGWTQGQIADHLQISRVTVINWMREFEIRPRPRGRRAA